MKKGSKKKSSSSVEVAKVQSALITNLHGGMENHVGENVTIANR